jgi:ribosomal protein S18 acetylase RimI-like enzyme
MTIYTVNKDNFEQVLPLIAAYQRFYKAEPNLDNNRAFFSQFLDDHSRGILFIMIDENGQAIGFSTLYFSFSSVSASGLCVLNDLYVIPDVSFSSIRSVGNKLVLHSFNYAIQNGYHKVCGTTDESNHTAQRLYNSFLERYKQYHVTKSTLYEYCAVATTKAILQ